MKTGFDLLETNEDEIPIDFLRKTVAILKILSKEALKTAERFANSCDRHVVTGNDMYYALMYEAHEFFNKNIDEEFLVELRNEQEHTYETEDEDSEEDEEEEEDETEDKPNEVYTIECKCANDKEFHEKVLNYAREWRNWFPEDPIKNLLKSAIDKTHQLQPME